MHSKKDMGGVCKLVRGVFVEGSCAAKCCAIRVPNREERRGRLSLQKLKREKKKNRQNRQIKNRKATTSTPNAWRALSLKYICVGMSDCNIYTIIIIINYFFNIFFKRLQSPHPLFYYFIVSLQVSINDMYTYFDFSFGACRV